MIFLLSLYIEKAGVARGVYILTPTKRVISGITRLTLLKFPLLYLWLELYFN